jgi:murein DD-endopeptidase MepM/ murein hydrolase activator NlpD
LSTTDKLNEADTALLARWHEVGVKTPARPRPGAHRRPRTWLKRHTRYVAALVVAISALGGAASATTGSERATTARLAVADAAPGTFGTLESTETPQPVVDNPVDEREAQGRPSRAERRVVVSHWVAPLHGPLRVTSCFGADRGDHRHGGLDLDGETGDVVRAIGAGTVAQAGYRYGSFGLTVVIDHGDTLTLYSHLSRASVRVGQRVVVGARLGAVGTTGRVTGSHLHLGISRTGTLAGLWDHMTDPARWLEARGVAVNGC